MDFIKTKYAYLKIDGLLKQVSYLESSNGQPYGGITVYGTDFKGRSCPVQHFKHVQFSELPQTGTITTCGAVFERINV